MPGYNDMRIPTVKIKNTRTGETRKINAVDWATDLGQRKWREWTLLTEYRAPEPVETTVVQTASGPLKVGVEEAATMDTGINETDGYRQVQRRRGRPRKHQVPNELEK